MYVAAGREFMEIEPENQEIQPWGNWE